MLYFIRVRRVFLTVMFPGIFCVQKEVAEEETEIDPDVAAMMGFGGFTSSKK